MNNFALLKTKSSFECGRMCHDFVCGDLLTCFRCAPLFDIIVFNPPYVPTDDEELQRAITTRDISASWAGGLNGRVVINRFLDTVSCVMQENSILYLVAIEVNNIDCVMRRASENDLSGCVILKRKAGIELLYILRFCKLNSRVRHKEKDGNGCRVATN